MPKGYINPTVLLILTLITLSVAAVIYFNSRLISNVKEKTPLTQPIQTPIPSAKVMDPTPNWKTYRGPDFEFKYPPDVNIKLDDQGWNGYVYIYKLGPTQRDRTELYDSIGLRIKTENLNGRKIEDIARNEFSNSNSPPGEIVVPLTKTTFNGREAYTYTARGLGDFKHIIALENDKVIMIIDSTNDPSNQGFERIVDQILSTFQFLQ